jgi:hypothetical protein
MVSYFEADLARSYGNFGSESFERFGEMMPRFAVQPSISGWK